MNRRRVRTTVVAVILSALIGALLVGALVAGEQSQCDWWRQHDPATYQLNCR